MQEACEAIFHLALKDSQTRVALLKSCVECCETNSSKYEKKLTNLISDMDMTQMDPEVAKAFFQKCMHLDEKIWNTISLDVCSHQQQLITL